MSKFYIIKCWSAFLVDISSFKSLFLYAYTNFCGLKHLKPDCFSCQLTKVNFWVPMKDMCHLSYNANIAIIISNFQQKYVAFTAMRRSGGVSKILLMKKLKSKVYVSFLISLYLGCITLVQNATVHSPRKAEFRSCCCSRNL